MPNRNRSNLAPAKPFDKSFSLFVLMNAGLPAFALLVSSIINPFFLLPGLAFGAMALFFIGQNIFAQAEGDSKKTVAGLLLTMLGAAGAGAMIGTVIFPGVGTILGAGIGFLFGALTSAIVVGVNKFWPEKIEKSPASQPFSEASIPNSAPQPRTGLEEGYGAMWKKAPSEDPSRELVNVTNFSPSN